MLNLTWGCRFVCLFIGLLGLGFGFFFPPPFSLEASISRGGGEEKKS